MFKEKFRNFSSRIKNRSEVRFQRQREAEKAKFESDMDFLLSSGVIEKLEDVLSESDFVASTLQADTMGVPPVFTPEYTDRGVYTGDPYVISEKLAYAFARWDMRYFGFTTLDIWSPWEQTPVDMWREVKLLPDSTRREVTVVGSFTSKLNQVELNDSSRTSEVLRIARDFPAILYTPVQYAGIGAGFDKPWWQGMALNPESEEKIIKYFDSQKAQIGFSEIPQQT